MKIRVGIDAGEIRGSSNRELQMAMDALACRGGGVLEIAPGTYLMHDSLHVAANVTIRGAGAETVLRKCAGPASPLTIDADYGQLKVTPASAEGFGVGMGITVSDDLSGCCTTVSRIIRVEDGVIHFADHLVKDYTTENNVSVACAFPVISGVEVANIVVERLVVDGNKNETPAINGCCGGGIYLFKAGNCRISACEVRDFNGDGISFQITRDVTVEDAVVTGCTGLGLHPGTGSTRAAIRRCRMQGNALDGLFLCWRVQESVVEDCCMRDNGRYGISIGHKDTDNGFRNNRVSGNALAGIYFREEKLSNAGSRNTFIGNTIEGNGRERPSAAVEIRGQTRDLVFEENVIRPGERKDGAGQTVAFLVGPRAQKPTLGNNRIAAHPGGEMLIEQPGEEHPGDAR